jgi:hypothetical protein
MRPPENRLGLGLHPKWRDVSPFGYVLDGLIRQLDGPSEMREAENNLGVIRQSEGAVWGRQFPRL